MENLKQQVPLSVDYNTQEDTELIFEARNGSKKHLDLLIRKHQDYIYNVAIRLVLEPEDAQDITQEVLIKMVTNLSKFEGKSAFRTWLYRIVVNHFLSRKQAKHEKNEIDFIQFGENLSKAPDIDLNPEEEFVMQETIEESRIGCMTAMLLCLDRHQRLIFVLGEIFNVDHNIGAEIFEISKENYRKKLSRARKDLYAFMNNKCGLINTSNPCRCKKKTKAFIQRGWVDPQNLKFGSEHLNSIRHTAFKKEKDFEMSEE